MKPIFRSAMFGFSKEDVFNFITKQNKQYETKVAELNEIIEKQATEFERDSAELVTLRNAANESQELLKSISAFVSEILDDKMKILNCANIILDEEKETSLKFAEMKIRVENAEKLREKAEKFDQLSGVLSSIFNQPENVVASEVPEKVAISNELNSSQSVAELLELLESLSSHCEKLKNVLSPENENA